MIVLVTATLYIGAFFITASVFYCFGQLDFSSFLTQNLIEPFVRFQFLVVQCVIFLGLGVIIYGLKTYLSRTSHSGHKIMGLAFFLAALITLPAVFFSPIYSVTHGYFTLFCLFIGGSYWLLMHYLTRGLPVESTESPSQSQAGDTSMKRLWMVMGITFLAYTTYFSWYTIQLHYSLFTTTDLAIYDQAFYHIKKTGLPLFSVYGPPELSNHFGRHFSPVLYLIAPFYAIFPGPETLLVAQSGLLGSAVFLIGLLAFRKTRSLIVAGGLCLAYVFYPAIHGVNTFDFHEIVFIVPILLMAFYFLETRNNWGMCIALTLALLTKEDVPLTVAMIGAYLILVGNGRWRLGILIIAVSVTWFIAVLWIATILANGVTEMTENNWIRFTDIAASGYSGPASIIMTIITNPLFAVKYAISGARQLYLMQLLGPLLLLPLLAGLKRWLIILPAAMAILLASFTPHFSIRFQYSAAVVPILFYYLIMSVWRLPGHNRLWATIAVVIASILFNARYGHIDLPRNLPDVDARKRQTLEKIEDLIPGEASVAAANNVLPQISTRDYVRLFPNYFGDEDYILVNFFDSDYQTALRHDPDTVPRIIELLKGNTYGVALQENGLILLKRGADPQGNTAAIDEILSPACEAENMPGYGVKVEDPPAHNGYARIFDPSSSKLARQNVPVVFGPNVYMAPGSYSVFFVVRADFEDPSTPVATVDVFGRSAGIIARDVVTGVDLQKSGYTAVRLPVEVMQDIPFAQFRVFSTGVAPIWVDRIYVQYHSDPD